MRIVGRSILVAILAAASAFSAFAMPRDGDARAVRAGAAADGGFVQVDNDDRWRGARREWRHGDPDPERGGVMQVRLLPFEAILGNVARAYPGHHIGVEGPYQQGGRWIYRIKWLTPDGRVIFVFVDAETGEILGQRGGR